ncbi:class I SAM-dependent methyltransferase [Bergeyella sp. RCAD1439]|uniref:class I SAM-dependent methyltransferase n=1 Tax=Bergeyella anatis TaxID=3113737 RepID=UPI002E183DCB|nr:class I SAM-dependent methyltransferase [Bergeyella sp. RCAD1439]
MIDLPGKAIYDYWFDQSRTPLFVHDTFGPKVEMPVSLYFRQRNQMPLLEKKALRFCQGKILDIGAGAGSHALELQKENKEVSALELSPSACEVMKNRGVKRVICNDIFNFSGETFDTLLLLMNGIGLCSDLDGFASFLDHAQKLLSPEGELVFDSCDISYMFQEQEKPEDYYYGEVSYRYQYGSLFTDWFQWLYLDKATMQAISSAKGWKIKHLVEDQNHQYLVSLYR